MLEVVEYSLKERFNMKYLHQVSYLRLQDVVGVCLSYCCLSGTTCALVVVQHTADFIIKKIYKKLEASLVIRVLRRIWLGWVSCGLFPI